MSNRAVAEVANVNKNTVKRIREAQVEKSPPDSDKGGMVIGRDGKSYCPDLSRATAA